VRRGICHRTILPALLVLVWTCALQALAADSGTLGAWSSVKPWPLIAIHAVLMPDGRVLTYGTTASGKQTGFYIYDVWDPSAGLDAGHTTLPNTTGTDIFCSSQVVLPAGNQVFIAGGDNWTGSSTTNTGNNNSNVFDIGSDTLTRQSDMNRARWYSSSITLLNGETYIQGGRGGGTDHPEIRDVNGAFRLLSGADTSALNYYYPRNFIAPDGKVFGYDTQGHMYYVDPAGSGTLTSLGQFSGPKGIQSSAAMFRPGRILQFGGSDKTAKIIDITAGWPVVKATQSLSTQRMWVNATILADGKVLATGGSEVRNELTGVNYSAEIWDPITGQWTRGVDEVQARLYHSTALLLPDASVLVAGGGAPGPQKNLNVEVYYPPYLFDASGAWATRPEIAAASSYVEIGESFTMDLADAAAVGRVVLVKTGSVSHSFNFDQRFVELTFQQAGSRLTVQSPTRAADAPPGHYLLFALSPDGAPSIGRIVKLGVAAVQPPPTVTPNTGMGLAGEYFNNKTLTGSPVMQRTEAVNFDWSSNSPGPGVNKDNFSVRWTGKVEAAVTGDYTFQTISNDGVRLWINGVLVVNNWTNHAAETNDSPVVTLTNNQRYAITMEFYESMSAAIVKLKWKRPGDTSFAAVPKTRLYAN